MDKTKKPGIITDTIMLIKLHFSRYPVNPLNMRTKLTISYQTTCNSDSVGQGIMEAKIKGFTTDDGESKDVFEAEMAFVGVFRKDAENPNLELESFINNQAPGHIFPYIREMITNLSTRANIPPIILPPVNLAALLELDLDASFEDNSVTPDIDIM